MRDSDAPLLDWHREDGDKNSREEGNVVCTDAQQEQVEQSMAKKHVDHIWDHNKKIKHEYITEFVL